MSHKHSEGETRRLSVSFTIDLDQIRRPQLHSPSSTQLRNLPLHTGTDLREGEAEFLSADPSDGCSVDDERIHRILREDATL